RLNQTAPSPPRALVLKINLGCLSNRQAHYRFLVALIALQDAGYCAFVHDRYSVALSQYFFHVAAYHYYRDAVLGKLAHELIDLCLRTDVDAPRRLIEYQNLRIER